MKHNINNTMLSVSASCRQHPVLFGIGALYVLYAFVLVISFVGAMIYDYVNGGYEAFHLVYKMHNFSLMSL